MTFLKKINSGNSSISNMLFVFCITLLGVFLRVQYLQKADFVINDGGMFYTMILDLQKNGYILPRFTSYNLSQIPYTYPPLSFYTGALLNQFLHIDLITIFRLYPLFFNILSIPAVYFLAKEITKVNRQAILATAFYAVLLSSFESLISGGGLTRSPAHTFFIVALYFYLVFLRTHRRKDLILSIVSAALMTLYHIEYCWILVFSMVLFSVYSLKLKECLKIGLIYSASVAVFTSPYWVVIIAYHGLSPFIAAFTAGEFSVVNTIVRLAIMVFTEETLVPFIDVLAIIGILYCIFSRKFIPVVWLILIAFLNPRSANRTIIFPVILLAAIAVDQLICPALDQLRSSQNEAKAARRNKSGLWLSDPQIYSHIFIAFAISFPFFLGFINSLGNSVLQMVSKPELAAMEWVKNNTPETSRFVVMDPSIEWDMDLLGEWFPTFAQRKSLTTIQGTEWLPNSAFDKNKKIYDDFKACEKMDEVCLEEWSKNNQMDFSYLLITKKTAASGNDNYLAYFAHSIDDSHQYEKVFENDTVLVFHKK